MHITVDSIMRGVAIRARKVGDPFESRFANLIRRNAEIVARRGGFIDLDEAVNATLSFGINRGSGAGTLPKTSSLSPEDQRRWGRYRESSQSRGLTDDERRHRYR
jgi:hypothetical protein